MNRIIKTLLFLSMINICNSTLALDSNTVELSAENNVANMEMVVKDNFIKSKYASAENRFLQVLSMDHLLEHECLNELLEDT